MNLNKIGNIRIGIVGGSGFVGSNLAEEFLIRGFKVRILDIKEPPKFLEKYENLEFLETDICNLEKLKKALTGVDIVINSAVIQIPDINVKKELAYKVNIIGTQNVCQVVHKKSEIKGLILTGTWHVFGERGYTEVINEEYGYHPDKTEKRSKLYVISKIAQEVIVRYYNIMSNKVFTVIRLGTVLGYGMPAKTAANIFITRGLKGDKITPYKHSMYRPMFYVDIRDVRKAFVNLVNKILKSENVNVLKEKGVFNLFYPKPITILELAKIVRDVIVKCTNGNVKPEIEVVDLGEKSEFSPDEVKKIQVNIDFSLKVLGMSKLISPKESIEYIVKTMLRKENYA